MARLALVCMVVGCGSASPPTLAPAPAAVVVAPPPVVDEQAKHDELVAAHRAIEDEQQSALAAACDEPKGHEPHERCLPSCYPTELPDARAGKKLLGAVEVAHLACEPSGGTGTGPFAIIDEIGAKLGVRPARGGFPRGHRKGTWQATVEAALVDAERPKLARGDVIVVSGAWHELANPLTKQRLRCVTFSHYTRLHRALDGCGADGALACEATGNAAARGINVVHFRLDEARTLQAAGKTTECQQAALEAVAIARGLPRWRQYAKLNVAKWTEHPGYRTRFDGVLDEDALFAEAARQGGEAQEVYVACGGAASAPTTVTQEQSFHTCW